MVRTPERTPHGALVEAPPARPGRPRRHRRSRQLARALALLALLAGAGSLALVNAPSALAHAQLLGTVPAQGATASVQPAEVIFEFNQPVGGTLGAVRVYDAQGGEVDDLAVEHPGGHEHWMGVGLKAHLPDGTYTATYRVISADTHVVYGGFVFNIGHPGAAPRFTVSGLISRNRSGEVTAIAFGVVRALDYLSIALLAGGLAFVGLAWLPALRRVAGADRAWEDASRAFARRCSLTLRAAIAIGFAASVLGFLLQGAVAAGVSLWTALKSAVLEDTLNSRFGAVWGGRAIDWLVLGTLLALLRAARRDPVPVLRPAPLGADGLALQRPPPRPLLAFAGAGALYLALTPALSGHASVQSPVWVFFPSDALHVLAASTWVGGIIFALLVLPAATRRLAPPARTELLLATLASFSPVALTAVIAIAATGIVQAYIDVRSLDGLVQTTYGVLILVKTGLFAALVGFGWVNRRRVLPALTGLVKRGMSPGATGTLARRSLRGELAVMTCVLGVTAALITYAPPIDAASGPYSTSARLGPAQLEMTVEPARTGLNTVHLYLIDARTGVQFTQTKELLASARLPSRGIGPISLRANLAGPGHYILTDAALSPGGRWQIQLTDRVSEFQEYSTSIAVPIR